MHILDLLPTVYIYAYRSQVSLYKILFHFKTVLLECIILLRPPPAKPTLLHCDCAIIAQYAPAY